MNSVKLIFHLSPMPFSAKAVIARSSNESVKWSSDLLKVTGNKGSLVLVKEYVITYSRNIIKVAATASDFGKVFRSAALNSEFLMLSPNSESATWIGGGLVLFSFLPRGLRTTRAGRKKVAPYPKE